MPETVEGWFDALLSRQGLTGNQQSIARRQIAKLDYFFNSNFGMSNSLVEVGSCARGTLCANERDIDLLAPLSLSQYWKRYQSDSRDFLFDVRTELNNRYAATRVSSRQVAVKFDFTDISITVVPCFEQEGGGFLMPDGNSGWRTTNPPFHTELIRNANHEHGLRLTPLIKLVKAWNAANGHRLNSVHLELIVEKAKRGFPVTHWPVEVALVLGVLPGWLSAPFPDPWNPSAHVDDYLAVDVRSRLIRDIQHDIKLATAAEEHRKAGRVGLAIEHWHAVYQRS